MRKQSKTIRIEELVAEVNRMNRESTVSADVRLGWNMFLENILMATDNYHGFRYLGATEVPTGELPGIEGQSPNATFPDVTRRNFFPCPVPTAKAS